jgi:glycosyltransferase involved in cell wall biosynthesis
MGMHQNPLVSIVTPSYNQGRYLEETIESVIGQSYSNIEYFVVDGGSKDNSVDLIRKYQDRIKWWVSEPDHGQTDAINKGFARARGDVFAWINSDDTYEPGAIAEAVDFLQNHLEIGMVYGNANFIDSEGNIIGRFNSQQTSYRRLRRGGVYIPQQAAFWRGKLWQQVGPLDPDYYFAMDYDLWVRLARISQIHYLPRLWANFRLHQDAKTIFADDRCWPEMLQIHKRDGGNLFSLIYVRYFLRRLFAAGINWRRKRMLK